MAGKNILLLDADSVFPNIALMKLSTFYKDRGDKVILKRLKIPVNPHKRKKNIVHKIPVDLFDKVYCSVVFDNTFECIKGEGIIFGGTGFDIKINLPKEVESLPVDYSVYPENVDTSFGFLSRGCIRNCKFCKVPAKEGKPRRVAEIDDIFHPDHSQIKFLDNNILSVPSHEEIFEELIDRKIKHQFNSGFDFRLLNETNSNLINQLRKIYMGTPFFAFDDWSYKKQFEKSLDLMPWIDDNWHGCVFYVYCDAEEPISNLIKRLEFMKEKKILPYVMRNINCWESENDFFYARIGSWANSSPNFIKRDFYSFCKVNYKNKKQNDKAIELYYSNR